MLSFQAAAPLHQSVRSLRRSLRSPRTSPPRLSSSEVFIAACGVYIKSAPRLSSFEALTTARRVLRWAQHRSAMLVGASDTLPTPIRPIRRTLSRTISNPDCSVGRVGTGSWGRCTPFVGVRLAARPRHRPSRLEGEAAWGTRAVDGQSRAQSWMKRRRSRMYVAAHIQHAHSTHAPCM